MMRIHRFDIDKELVWIGAAVLFLLSFTVSTGNAQVSGIKVNPQFVFSSVRDPSKALHVINEKDQIVEVTVEAKYGYPASDDSDRVKILMPETRAVDDRSAVEWLRIFPIKFTLGPFESQVVRVSANPPAGIDPGEYWSRLMFTARPQGMRPQVAGKPGAPAPMLSLVGVTSIPYHYRTLNVSTGLTLTQPIEYSQTDDKINVIVPLSRSGNASFWGMMRCTVKDGSKTVFTREYKLITYKSLRFPMVIDRKDIPSGNYTMELVAVAERTDINQAYILKCKPISWSLPIQVK